MQVPPKSDDESSASADAPQSESAKSKRPVRSRLYRTTKKVVKIPAVKGEPRSAKLASAAKLMPEPPVAPAPEVVVVREVPSAPAPVAAPHVEMVSNTSAPAQAPDVACGIARVVREGEEQAGKCGGGRGSLSGVHIGQERQALS